MKEKILESLREALQEARKNPLASFMFYAQPVLFAWVLVGAVDCDDACKVQRWMADHGFAYVRKSYLVGITWVYYPLPMDAVDLNCAFDDANSDLLECIKPEYRNLAREVMENRLGVWFPF